MSEADQNYFSRLYVEHEQGLYGFVYSLLHSRSDTDDVIQETMAQLWEHFGEYDRSRPFFPWACRFAYRKVLMHRRKESARRIYLSENVLETLAADHPEAPDWEESRRRALKACMSKLKPEQAELLRARYEADESLAQLADRAGRTVNSLYKSLQRIRQGLVSCVEQRLSAETVQ